MTAPLQPTALPVVGELERALERPANDPDSCTVGFPTSGKLMCHLIRISSDLRDKLYVRLRSGQLVILKPRRRS